MKPRFIFQIRTDPSSTTGIKDLQGNTWAVQNNQKLDYVQDPFGGNNAFKIDSLTTWKWLVLKNGNALWSKDSIPNFTLAVWVKLERFGHFGTTIPFSVCNGGYECIVLAVQASTMSYQENGIKKITYANTGDNSGKWNYFEWSFEGTTLRFFKNGKLLDTKTIPRSFAGLHQAANWIGQFQWEPNYGSNGSIFYLYDFCLLEGVLHKKDYEVPHSYLTLDNLGTLIAANKYLCVRKNGQVSRSPMYCPGRLWMANNEHKLNLYVLNTGLYSSLYGNTKQCTFHRNWVDVHNNVQAAAGTDIFGHNNVLRFDSSKGINSYMNLAENIGQNYSFECFFKFADNKNATWLVGATTVNIVIGYQNGVYTLSWRLNSQNNTVAGGNGRWTVVPNRWYHLYYQYVGGTRFKIALDGNWSKEEMTTLKPQDNTWLSIGGWDDDANGSNKAFKSIIDMSYVFVYKTGNPPYNAIKKGFTRPVHSIPVGTRNCQVVEYKMIPLLQDIQNSPIRFRVANGIYGIDPTVDLVNFEKESKIFHITNEDGCASDITGKTEWTDTDIVPELDLNGSPLATQHAEKYGSLIKTGGPDIIIGLNDFTFLIDIKIYGPKNISTAAGEEYKKRYYLIGGDINALESSISEDMKWMNLGYAGNHPGNEWATITGLDLKYGQEYRIIEQRKNGIVDVWINGRHVYQGKLLIDMSGKIRYVAAPETTASMNLNGSIRNAVLWNKAVIPMPGGGQLK